LRTFGTNTLNALQNARMAGLVVRDFVYIRARRRDNPNETEALGLWNGKNPVSVEVRNPQTGSIETRNYTGLEVLSVPPIPATKQLEVRTIRLRFSNLSEEMLNAIRLYDPRMAEIEIHRGIMDPNTYQMLDPAYCRFFGFINRSPITTGKADGEGSILLECVSNARMLTKTSGRKFSHQELKKRSNDQFGKYLDVAGAWRIWWGQPEKIGEKKESEKIKQRWFRA